MAYEKSTNPNCTPAGCGSAGFYTLKTSDQIKSIL